MTTTLIIILLGTGIGVGFASGLLGVGGAFIMGPVQYIVYTNMGLPTDLAIKLAFGTNLLVILPTALSGVWRHQRNRAVIWKAAIIMGIFSLIGSLAGATIATGLPGEILKITLGAIILASAAWMLFSHPPEGTENPRNNPWLWAACALPIGFLTGFVGIGGGIVAVPLMILGFRFGVHRAIGTSLAMMIFTSAGGTVGYIINGLGTPGLPPYSIGYVNLQSWLILAVTSIGMAQVGAMTAHRLPARQLRYIFIAVMLYMGLKMVGLFDWLGWPI